jgi:glycine/D-amino acid oxidase-like deaminating enzyme
MLKAIVIGGGFYGCSIALYLAKQRGFAVTVLEIAPQIMQRASLINQARVHNGYHYPRSLTTAARSRVNYPLFVEAHAESMVRDFTKLYALARIGSKISAKQMESLCRSIDAPLVRAPREITAMFSANTVSDVYIVEEYAFDSAILARKIEAELLTEGIDLRVATGAVAVEQAPHGIRVTARRGAEHEVFDADLAFNCTYCNLGQFTSKSSETTRSLRHELAEISLIEPPDELKAFGVTVMDGPFFSCMPFPTAGLHSLTHVRYTPHVTWNEDEELTPDSILRESIHQTRVEWMLRDAQRFLPVLGRSRYVRSLYEVKTVLKLNDGNDGRPIMLSRSPPYGRLFSVLGGKIDNIYDIIERLDAEDLAA